MMIYSAILWKLNRKPIDFVHNQASVKVKTYYWNILRRAITLVNRRCFNSFFCVEALLIVTVTSCSKSSSLYTDFVLEFYGKFYDYCIVFYFRRSGTMVGRLILQFREIFQKGSNWKFKIIIIFRTTLTMDVTPVGYLSWIPHALTWN